MCEYCGVKGPTHGAPVVFSPGRGKITAPERPVMTPERLREIQRTRLFSPLSFTGLVIFPGFKYAVRRAIELEEARVMNDNDVTKQTVNLKTEITDKIAQEAMSPRVVALEGQLLKNARLALEGWPLAFLLAVATVSISGIIIVGILH